MFKKFTISKSRLMLAFLLGIGIMSSIKVLLNFDWLYYLLIGLGIAVSIYIALSYAKFLWQKGVTRVNRLLDALAVEVILGAGAGLLLGIIISVLSSFPLALIRGLGAYLTIIVFMLCGYLGIKIGSRRAMDFFSFFKNNNLTVAAEVNCDYSKVLDTSAIIDGRIYDVCLSKFIDGKLIVPTFVIEELQHIADSSDSLRRNKGRRGLDLLAKMQKHPTIKIDIIEAEINEEKEVDNKLLRLCKELHASIITNDYNLNKVAELQGINVLNINELTNAVKVIVYPGETMAISVLKEGKEEGQGVGYLEDGTMVVVEDAQNEIGNDIEVVVTSVFQTAAGRMIFTRKHREDYVSTGGFNPALSNVQEVNLFG